MTPDELRSVSRNPFFLSRVYGPVRNVDVEAALGVTDDHFAEVDALAEPRGGDDVDEDADIVSRCIAVPILLPAGYQWEVEYYDNGEEAGVTHLLRCPAGPGPITIATIDAHPRGLRLRWNEATRIVAAARADPRNAPSADALLLLLRSIIVVDASDDAAAVREELAAAWIGVGASHDAAAEIATASVARTSVVPRDDDDEDEEWSEGHVALVALVATLP